MKALCRKLMAGLAGQIEENGLTWQVHGLGLGFQADQINRLACSRSKERQSYSCKNACEYR